MSTVLNIPLELIDVEEQVRVTFKPSSIAELAKDIEDHGLLQPLVVEQKGERFRLLIGERRLRALRAIGAAIAPCIVSTVAESKRRELQLTENIQREDLSTKDLAHAIKAMWADCGSVSEVAKRCNKSPSWVSKRLALALGVPALTASLMDAGIKDVELLYLFRKLEDADPVRAKILHPEVKDGTAGRDDIKEALTSFESVPNGDTKTGDLFSGEMPQTRGETVKPMVSDMNHAKRLADDLRIALDALEWIATQTKCGSPLALAMKLKARDALDVVSVQS